MESSTESDDRAHIVVLPFAQQGHINPLMQLARKLAGRGVRVTFVVSENTVPSADKGKTPNLEIVGVPDNLPAERSRGSSMKDSVDSMLNMEVGFRSLLQRLCDEPAGVSAVVYDVFMTWALSVASSLSLPCIAFCTSNATFCALAYQVPSLHQRGILPFRSDGDEDAPLPEDVVEGMDGGVPGLLPKEFPSELLFPTTHHRYKFAMSICKSILDGKAIILNTMEGLEPQALALVRSLKHVYTLGPLLLLSGCPSRLDVSYWPEQDHCLPWLDSHPPSSVLYVSFGSVASLPPSQFQQLALGLEASGQPFLWVVRPDSIDVPLEHALPSGFLDRTKDRGLIISWAPQLRILSHPSIGGFFTHGGWNSIVENLSLGSVPMICWPHGAEQWLSRRLIVDNWNIGLGLHHEPNDGVVKEEISQVIHDLFHGEPSKDLRNSSTKAGRMAKEAAAKHGSSYNNFEALYNYLTLSKGTTSR